MKRAFVTLASKSFLPGLDCLAYTTEKYNPGIWNLFDDRIIITTDIESYPGWTIYKADQEEYRFTGAGRGLEVSCCKLALFGFSQFDQVIFIETDVIVVADISWLWGPETEQYDFAAVQSWGADGGKPVRSIDGRACFHGGEWVVNRNLLKGGKFHRRLMEIGREGPYKWGDQYIINKALFDSDFKILSLEKEWDFVFRAERTSPLVYASLKDKLKMIHFHGPSKPWMTDAGPKVEATIKHKYELVDRWWNEYAEIQAKQA